MTERLDLDLDPAMTERLDLDLDPGVVFLSIIISYVAAKWTRIHYFILASILLDFDSKAIGSHILSRL